MIRKLTPITLVLLFAGFASAQSAEKPAEFEIDQLAASQWIRTDAAGTLHGTVDTPTQGATRRVGLARVVLVPLNGDREDVLRTRAGLDGKFSLENVSPGTYGLVVHGENMLASYSIHVLPVSQLGAKPVASSFKLAAAQPAAVSSTDLRVSAAAASHEIALRAIRSYVPMKTAAKKYDVHRFVSDPRQGKAVAPQSYRVMASTDGNLTGRLSLPADSSGKSPAVKNMNVLIVSGDKTVGRATAGADGKFIVSDLSPGVYGLIAAGESGFASVGFELLPNSRTASNQSDSPFRFASFAQTGDGIPVELVPSDEVESLINAIEEEVEEESYPEYETVVLDEFGWPVDGFATDGFGPGSGGFSSGGGSFGGGGGGGGGIGDVGGLLGAAAIGAAVIAADDDDNRNFASPAVPAP